MKELQPINQNVVIEPEEEKEYKTPSGLYIPETAKEKKAVGTVIALSNIENPEIAVGDKVIYKSYSGNEVELDDKKYLIVQYSDILAKIVETEEI